MDFKVEVVNPREPIDLRHLGVINEMRPIKCYIKPDGDLNDNPSLCLILEKPGFAKVIGQISLKMFMPVIQELRKMGHLQ